MTKEQKAEIDRLVNIWINGLMSVSNDAGWEGASLMARLIEFQGDLPPPSGNDQSNQTMINAIALLRKQHEEFPHIQCAMRMLLNGRGTRNCALAICARFYYQGVCPRTDKVYTDLERGMKIGMSLNEYRYEIGKAYPAIERELERVSLVSRYLVA